MDLNWVKLNKFKRFEKATLTTQGKVIVLIGANESGKSSILRALTYLNNEDQIAPSDLTRDLDIEVESDEIVIEAAFLLDDDDREAISNWDTNGTTKWFYVKKRANGRKIFEIKPKLVMNDKNRRLVIENANKIIKSKIKNKTGNIGLNPLFLPIRDSLKEIISELKKSLEETRIITKADDSTELNSPQEIPKNLSQNLVVSLENVIDDIKQMIENDGDLKYPEELKTLYNSLTRLYEYEFLKLNGPVIDILKKRIPIFVLFNDEHRKLPSTCNLSPPEPKNQTNNKPNGALENLFKIADLDLTELTNKLGNESALKTLINKANKNIKEAYKGKWRQADGIRPILEIHSSRLRISIENQNDINFEIHQRSDGFRQFIALINFLEAEHIDQTPILLIDEAELHLHYDAQADLMNILAQQNIASKVIYTTHSVGCLPEDLGTGVKSVHSIDDKQERSSINNKYWIPENSNVGLRPLLFGMGASSLSFLTLRSCIFVEGISDMLLLPTLFRQILNQDHLGFQMVHGTANIPKSDYGLLENDAPTVAFLLDNDQEGQKYKEQLQKSGVKDSKILMLPSSEQASILEDFICLDLYIEAINALITKWNDSEILLSSADFIGKDRPAQFKEWCKKNKIDPISKFDIAYELLDLALGDRQEILVDEKYKEDFINLYKNIIKEIL